MSDLDDISDSLRDHPFDAGTYGRSFADVYDDWYPSDDDTAAAVRRIAALAGERGRILELGVGTGRLALPLADLGLEVSGIDSSAEMLDVLSSKDRDGRITVVRGDVAQRRDWPAGPFDVVVATNNLLFNLTDATDQAGCVASSAAVLGPEGHLVVETIVPAPIDGRERHVTVKEVGPAGVVLIVTDADPVAGVVTAAHVELRDGEPVRLRPWRVRLVSVAEIDRWASDAGLELVERVADWSATPFDAESPAAVTTYRSVGP